MLSLGNKLSLTTQPIYKFVNEHSVDFDGVDDRIITDGEVVQYQHATYSFWCKSSETGQNAGVFGHGGLTVGSFNFNYSSNKPSLFLNGTGFYRYWDDTSAQDDGEWHHWVVYVDINDITNCKLYVDGVLQNPSTTVSTGSANPYTESLTIGSDQASGGNSFVGKIDEFAVYDRELTQAEITRMYNTYYSPNRIANGNFAQEGVEEVTNGDFSQEGSQLAENNDFSNYEPAAPPNSRLVGGVQFDDWSENPFSGTATFESITGGYRRTVVTPVNAGNPWHQRVTQEVSSDLTVGKHYRFTATFLTSDGSNFYARISKLTSADLQAGGEYTTVANTPRSIDVIFKCTANTDQYIDLWAKDVQSADSFVEVSNISFKEVLQDWTVADYSGTAASASLTLENGAVKITKTADSDWRSSFLRQTITYTNTKFYKVSFKIKNGNTAGANIYVRNNYDTSSQTIASGISLTSNFVEYTYYFQADSNSTDISFGNLTWNNSGSGGYFFVDDVTIKEVGQHWTVGSSDADNYVVFNGSTARLKLLNTSPVTTLTGSFLMTAGTTYKLIVDVASVTSGSIKVDGAGISELFDTAGVTTRTITPTANTGLTFYRASADVDLTLNSVILQELKHDATNLMLNAGNYQSANPLITSTKSMEFDGVDDYLTVSDDSSLDFAAGFSVSFWVYPHAADANDRMVCKGVTGTGEWMISFGSGQAIRVYTQDGDSVVKDFTSTNTLTLNEWAMVTVVVNRTSNKLQVYKNGGNLDEDSASWTSGWSNSAALTMGVNSSLAGDFDGRMTEVGIWDRELTSLEVASLYNQGMPTNLLVNRNNYQSGNPTVFNTKQVDFDGTDDYLDLGSKSATSSLTYSAWVKLTNNNIGNILSYGNTIFRLANATTINWWSDNAAAQLSTTISSIQNEWSHIVVTQTGQNAVIYLNGLQVNSSSSQTVVNTGTQVSSIGRYAVANNWHFTGEMSQIGIWNEALTADEVSSLYNHGLPIDLTTDQAAYESSANLTGYWRMGSGTLDNYPSIGYLTYGVIADQTNATLGSEIVINGDFATDSNWVKQAGWTISGGKAHRDGTGLSNSAITQDISVTSGKVYKLSYDRTYISGGGQTNVYSDFVSDGVNDTRGSYDDTTQETVTIVSYFSPTYTGTLTLRVYGIGTFTGSFDNVSVKEFGGNPAIMTNMFSSDIENGSPTITTGLKGYWKMGDGTNDEYPYIFDQTNPTYSSDLISTLQNGRTSGLNAFEEFTDNGNGSYTFGSTSTNWAGTEQPDADRFAIEVGEIYKFTFDYTLNSGSSSFGLSIGNTAVGSSYAGGYYYPSYNGSHTVYFTIQTANSSSRIISQTNAIQNFTISNLVLQKLEGNIATMTNMLEGNITNQYPLTKIRNYYRMGDGIMDGYPIIQDQTSPNLAHIPTTNLVTYSEDFTQSDWVKTGSTTVSATNLTSPTGTTNATRITGLTGAGSNDLRFGTSIDPASKTYTGSVYLKGSGTLRLQLSNNVDNAGSTTITLTSDWVRHNFTFGFNSTSGTLAITLDDTSGTATQFDIWGVQLEEQSQATAYLKSDGIAAVRKSATTNLMPYSEDFNNAAWSKSLFTFTANYATAPDGSQTAYRAVSSGGSYPQFHDTITGLTIGQVYTVSFYVKSDSTTQIQQSAHITSNGDTVNFTPTNDWVRIEYTRTATATSHTFVTFTNSGSAAASSYLIWGYQVEQQTQAETYAKTTGLPVTINLFTQNSYGTMTNMSSSDIVEDTP